MCIGPVRSNCHPWTGPIGRSSLFLDRSRFGSVQVHSWVGPVRLHLQNCRSCTLDRTEPRPNRCCPSLPPQCPPTCRAPLLPYPHWRYVILRTILLAINGFPEDDKTAEGWADWHDHSWLRSLLQWSRVYTVFQSATPGISACQSIPSCQGLISPYRY